MKSEELLKSALNDICTEEFSAFEDMPEPDLPKSFDRKMDRLFGGRKTGLRKAVRSRTKRIAIIAFAAVLLISVCGFAILENIFRIDKNSDPIYIKLSVAINSDAPETIEHYYIIEAPEGYQVNGAYHSETDNRHIVKYNNYRDFNREFSFHQYTVGAFNMDIIKDDDIIDRIIDYPEKNMVEVRYKRGSVIERFWTDGNYIYRLIGRRELLDMLDTEKLTEIYLDIDGPEYYIYDYRKPKYIMIKKEDGSYERIDIPEDYPLDDLLRQYYIEHYLLGDETNEEKIPDRIYHGSLSDSEQLQ